MKRTIFLLLVNTFPYVSWAQLALGLEEIVPAQVYVMHSSMDKDDSLANTSNIYVIKGLADTVWIFGTGYGDASNLPADTSDISFYKGSSFEPTENAMYDVHKVDSLITSVFALTKSNVKLIFITPHFHLDHINQEFVSGFIDSLNYPISGARILVHVNDEYGAKCNTACCNLTPCPSNPTYRGAPFHPTWTTSILNLFESIGDPSDNCNTSLRSINSASGTWRIVKGDTLHVTGSLNLDNESLKYRIKGAAPDGCFVENDWTTFPLHGNIPAISGIQSAVSISNIKVYPNPAQNMIMIKLEPAGHKVITMTLLNYMGQVVLSIKSRTSQFTLDSQLLPAGPYMLQFKSDRQFIGTKKLIVK